MRFRATLELHGKTATGLVVPDEVVEALGAGKRPAVVVSFAGYSYRKEHVRGVTEAKAAATRERRIAKVLASAPACFDHSRA
jgi:uncharacterized protein YdeI (YjbR/CyaY-like superfamily)